MRRSCGWSSPGGTPRPRAARTGSTPPWSCTSTSKERVAALHLGPLLSDAERRYLPCDATCEVWFERDGQVIGAGRTTRLISRRLRRALEHRHPTLRGSRLRRHPRSARSPHPALGRRRPHRVGQPGAGVPLPSPAAPSRRHHHHRTRRPPHRHRQRRPSTALRIAGAPTDHTPTRGRPLPRAHRRTRRLVVVRTVPATTTTVDQLADPVGDTARRQVPVGVDRVVSSGLEVRRTPSADAVGSRPSPSPSARRRPREAPPRPPRRRPPGPLPRRNPSRGRLPGRPGSAAPATRLAVGR